MVKRIISETAMSRKRITYTVVFMAIIADINSQEIKFGWSLGDFGWSYNFIGGYDIIDTTILKFNMSFEKINLMINTSVLYGTNKNHFEATEPVYNWPIFFEVRI